MSNYTTYNELIEQKIANTSELFYDEAMKRQEMNNAVRQMLQQYDIPEMIVRAEITFDSNGLASRPSDYYRMVKLWETDANGVESNVYQWIEPAKFDKIASSAAYYWTEDYVVADAARKLKVAPADSGTVDIRYVKEFTEMTNSTIDSGLSNDWDEAVAYNAAARLFTNANRYDEAIEYTRLAEERIMETYAVLKNPGGIKQGAKLSSKWDRVSLLGGFTSGHYDNSR